MSRDRWLIGVIRSSLIAFVIASAQPVAASSSATPSSSAIVAGEMLRICVDTKDDPAAIRALAASEHWASVDPATVPLKNRVVVHGKKKGDDRIVQRTAAWSYDRAGVPITVGLFDIPELDPRQGRQCEVMAWDLDPAQVDTTIRADSRVSDNSIPGFPMKAYQAAALNLSIDYIPSDAGSKVLHAFIVR